MKNALTFDLEEYFHAEAFARAVRPEDWASFGSRVVDVTERLLDILDYADARATFFVLGWVAERQPGLIREIHARRHELACHGYAHQMLHRLTPQEFAEDITRAKKVIEDAAGTTVIGYRAPTFSVLHETLWSLEILLEAGFQYDSSIFPILHDRYGIPDAPRFAHRISVNGNGSAITELPLSTIAVLGRRVPVAGGGYFRLTPYRLTRHAIRHLNLVEGQPAVVYLHPWELDLNQPRMPVGWLTHLRHSINIDKTEDRLRQLLADFHFAPAEEVLREHGLLGNGEEP
ncbi:MAG TPA: XrtA system polysaccharide deacetylase [Methylomirabilota bacterium]|nr:XrtA system polysaccharide deacetylase [Methylomirabilota bacterium]